MPLCLESSPPRPHHCLILNCLLLKWSPSYFPIFLASSKNLSTFVAWKETLWLLCTSVPREKLFLSVVFMMAITEQIRQDNKGAIGHNLLLTHWLHHTWPELLHNGGGFNSLPLLWITTAVSEWVETLAYFHHVGGVLSTARGHKTRHLFFIWYQLLSALQFHS